MNKYTRIIEWSDKDQCYLGCLPELLEGHCTHAEPLFRALLLFTSFQDFYLGQV
ncbi:MAG: hypothetical protein RRY13_08525 [Akkermansia sp.]